MYRCPESTLYLCKGGGKKKLIVTYSELRAKELCENYRLFDKNVLFYPAKDLIFTVPMCRAIFWYSSGSVYCRN